MVRKKIDNRIRVMIENGVALGHRSLFVIVGNKARDQVVLLHHMLSKAQVRSRPSVLWCYKSELGFSSHRKKRMRQIQKRMKRGGGDVNEDDPFELFVAATTIRYCYYAETHKILGNTYGMCVLQDFEALTPNLLARTVETVEGGGIVTILLRSMDSLRQLYAMTMDVHSRYRTEAHRDVVGRFNERFILSLASCRTCVVMDDQLNVLPMSSHVLNVEAVPARSKEDRLSERDSELSELVKSLEDTQPLGTLVGCTRTLDQAKALLKFVEAISEKTLRSTVVMTAARGRGKSAALGLAMASAVAFGYSNIFVTSPSPENLKTLFEFVFKGFDALEYQEHLDYDVVQSTNPEFNKAIVRVNIYREHRQTIQYIHPADAHRLGQAELVCIDEAAAIPLPMVKALLGPYLVFMSSTINGYEGTGRSLSLKLVQQLREQTAVLSSVSATAAKTQTIESTVSMTTGRVLHEVELQESVRYRPGDSVEAWLNELLCLNIASVPHIASGCPLPESCELYYVSRDTLFSYHSASEAFLQRLMSIYVSSHYKNTPNDLQMLSDAPAHHLFCMLGPVDSTQNSLPEVLCVLQVSLEGEILKASVIENSARGKRAAGDLIPWTISQQFQDPEFPGLAGGRVVRIATHPDYQGMGYGSRALQLLQKYYEGKFPSLDDPPKETADTVGSEVSNLLEEKLGPRKNLPPLLLKLSERPAERLDYLGVSYGLTSSLLRFWKKAGYTAVYLRQTTNELTGEHSCIMLKQIGDDTEQSRNTWLSSFSADFQRRFLSLLAYQFSKFTPSLALNILPQRQKNTSQELRRADVERDFGDYDLRRLETYARNMADHHVITDLLPAVARLYFLGRLDVSLSIVQQALLLGLGLQHKTVDIMEKEIELPASQLLALFNRTMRKVSQFLNSVVEKAVENKMVAVKDVVMEPLKETMATELDEAAQEFADKQQQEKQKLMRMNLSEYAVAGSEEQWSKALSGSSSSSSKPRNIVSVQSAEGKRKPAVSAETPGSDHRKKHDKGKKKKFKVQH